MIKEFVHLSEDTRRKEKGTVMSIGENGIPYNERLPNVISSWLDLIAFGIGLGTGESEKGQDGAL